jgi:hypothetical protein
MRIAPSYLQAGWALVNWLGCRDGAFGGVVPDVWTAARRGEPQLGWRKGAVSGCRFRFMMILKRNYQ